MVMKYNSNLHTKGMLIKILLSKIENLVSKPFRNRKGIIVLNYHGTQLEFIGNFESQIKFMVEHFIPIAPSQFEEYTEAIFP